jgi:hypothetical protein
MSRESIPIIDRDGRLVAILAGHPDDKTWSDVSSQAAKALENARQSCSIKKNDPRRGIFSALQCGVSYGGGQTMPQNLCPENDVNANVLDDLNQTVAFQRINGFSNG